MASQERILRMARNAYQAWASNRADLSKDTETKAKELQTKIAAYDVANGQQEELKKKLVEKTAEVEALIKEIGQLRVDIAKLVDAKLPRTDERRKLFRNDK